MSEKKLRVLVANDLYLPYMDGVVNCMHSYLMNYPSDIDATACAPQSNKKYVHPYPYKKITWKAFSVPYSGGARFGFVKNDKNFLKKIDKMDFDIIHVHSPFNAMLALTEYAQKKGIPIVATFHTNFRKIFKDIFKFDFIVEPYIKKLGKRYSAMNAVFAGTPATQKQLESFGFEGKCIITPFGTDIRNEEGCDYWKKYANNKFSLKEDEVVFCFVGRLVESKRVQFSLSALKKVKEAGYDFKFIIAGTGNYENKLKSLSKKYNLQDNCIFAGFIDNDTKKSIYARSLLLLFPSILDNFALVKVEAATFETVGVYINSSNTAFGTQDGFNSILSNDDVGSFAQKIIWALDNKKEAEQLGLNARSTLYFTWEDSAKKLVQAYNEVISDYKNAVPL